MDSCSSLVLSSEELKPLIPAVSTEANDGFCLLLAGLDEEEGGGEY